MWQLQLRQQVLPAALVVLALTCWPDGAGTLVGYWLPREVVLVVLALLWAVPRLWALPRWDLADMAPTALLATTLASLGWAVSPLVGMRAAVQQAAVLAVVLAVRPQRDDGRMAPRALEAALWVLAGSGLLEALGLWHWSAAGFSPGGLLGQRNHLAHALVLGTTGLVLLETAPRHAPLVTLVTWVVTLTRCRTAWWAALPLLVYLLSQMLRHHKVEPRRLVLGVGAGVVLALLVPNALRWKEAHPYAATASRMAEADAGSGAGRVSQARATWRMWLDAPLTGVGVGQWRVHHPRYSEDGNTRQVMLATGEVPRLALSGWLAQLAQGGLMAVLCWLLWMWMVWDRARWRGVAWMACVGLLEALDAGSALPMTGAFFAVTAGTLLGPRLPNGPGGTRATAGLLSLVLLLGAWLQVEALRALGLWRQGNAAQACVLDPTRDVVCVEALRAALARGEAVLGRQALTLLERHHPHHPSLVAGRRELWDLEGAASPEGSPAVEETTGR